MLPEQTESRQTFRTPLACGCGILTGSDTLRAWATGIRGVQAKAWLLRMRAGGLTGNRGAVGPDGILDSHRCNPDLPLSGFFPYPKRWRFQPCRVAFNASLNSAAVGTRITNRHLRRRSASMACPARFHARFPL